MKISAFIEPGNPIYTHWNKMGYKRASLHRIVFKRLPLAYLAEDLSPSDTELLKPHNVKIVMMSEPVPANPVIENPSSLEIDASGNVTINTSPVQKTTDIIIKKRKTLKEYAAENDMTYQNAYKLYKEGKIQTIKENGMLFVEEQIQKTIENLIFDKEKIPVWEPSYNSGKSAWTEHVSFAHFLIEKIKPQTIVELGVWYGDSLFAFVESSLFYQPTIVGIDKWEGDIHVGKVEDDSVYNTVKMIFDKYPNVRLVKNGFQEEASNFSEKSIDLLHIDGTHTYEAVKNDFNSYLSKMTDTGIILFHDIEERKEGFEVWKFWDELKAQYNTIEYKHSSGLGILFLDEDTFLLIKKSELGEK